MSTSSLGFSRFAVVFEHCGFDFRCTRAAFKDVAKVVLHPSRKLVVAVATLHHEFAV